MDAPPAPLSGYLSPNYGASFRPFGEIIRLPQSGIQLLKRDIAEGAFDLVGTYPYVMSANWPALADDAEFLRDTGAVSVTLVGDPFHSDEIRNLVADWSVCLDFKTHFVVDLHKDWRRDCSRDTRRQIRRALEMQSAGLVAPDPGIVRQLWVLYQNTIVRHNVRGVQRLSEKIIEHQLHVEGILLVLAEDKAGVSGALMAFDHGDTACFHLLFLSDRAYGLGTSYALFFKWLEALESRDCRYANLGGAAGAKDDPSDGLAQFKRRWAQEERTALLCGNILNAPAYDLLSAEGTMPKATFFPQYRAPGGPFEWRPPV